VEDKEAYEAAAMPLKSLKWEGETLPGNLGRTK